MISDAPRPYRPPGGVTLRGPFLTVGDVAARFGRDAAAIIGSGSLLSLDSEVGVGKAYPAFEFDDRGQRSEVAFLAPLLTRRVSHAEACDWLLRPLPALRGLSPMEWLAEDLDVRPVIDALPHPSRQVPGSLATTEAEILAFVRRRPWTPQPYQVRPAA